MARTGRKSKLTAQLTEEICAKIRDGVFPTVSAGCCGIGKTTFFNWLRRGGSKRAPKAFREFRDAIDVARSAACCDAECRVFKEDALAWLRRGPGRGRWGDKTELEISGNQRRPLRIEQQRPAPSRIWRGHFSALRTPELFRRSIQNKSRRSNVSARPTAANRRVTGTAKASAVCRRFSLKRRSGQGACRVKVGAKAAGRKAKRKSLTTSPATRADNQRPRDSYDNLETTEHRRNVTPDSRPAGRSPATKRSALAMLFLPRRAFPNGESLDRKLAV